MYWHRVQHKPNNLMKTACEECKNMHDDHLVSWFSTVMALANKLQIDLSVVKNWGEKKFKRHVNNCLRQNFLEYSQHKKTSRLVSDKLTTFYKIKERALFKCTEFRSKKSYY